MCKRVLILLVAMVTASLWAVTPLEITLVSEVRSIKPGVPFYLGLSLHHGEGYHTYWKHPGIVGVPTNVNWTALPPGFKADPIDWPEPERTYMFQIKAQGHERDLVLPIKVTPPGDLKPGEKVTFKGKASWMCCNRECNPGFKDLSIELPVGKVGAPDLDLAWKAKIDKELALRPLSSAVWEASAVSDGKQFTLVLKPKAGAAKLSKDDAAKLIYFTEDGMVDSDKPQEIECLPDGGLRLRLVEAEFIIGDRPKELRGLLVRPAGWEQGGRVRCLKVVAPLTSKS
jgi:thiol:disulfide interchange protein DsbD